MMKSFVFSSDVLMISSLLCVIALKLYWGRVLSGRYDCNTWIWFVRIRVNSYSSPSSNISLSVGVHTACCWAQPRPCWGTVQQFDQYRWSKTPFSDAVGIPWLRNTRSGYSSREHDVNRLLTWSAAVSLSLMTTPSAVSQCFHRAVALALYDHTFLSLEIRSLLFLRDSAASYFSPTSRWCAQFQWHTIHCSQLVWSGTCRRQI